MFHRVLNVLKAEFKTSSNKFALCSNLCEEDQIPCSQLFEIACNAPHKYSKSRWTFILEKFSSRIWKKYNLEKVSAVTGNSQQSAS